MLLRVMTCGSVDDGKSTLIGRLLYDAQLLADDHLAALERDSRRWGTQGDELDFALLVDGLSAEREQGITIDVAYRFFDTPRRRFIVADSPGHPQYTRNMVTAASTADAAVLVADASKGLVAQTRLHAHIAALLGVRQVVLAVNKMDLAGYAQDVFAAIERDFRAFGARLGIAGFTAIPVSGLRGDNVVAPGTAMEWYRGPTLLHWLESVELDRQKEGPLRMPVQWVNRPGPGFRGYAGTVAGGSVRPGQRVRVLPSGRESVVDRVVTFDGDIPEAVAGEAVTLVLRDDVDITRGDLLCDAAAPAECADRLEAMLIWTGDEPLLPGRAYLARIGSMTVPATVTEIRHRIEPDTLERRAAATLPPNGIAVAALSLNTPAGFDRYEDNRATGSFVLFDRTTNATAAAGMVRSALRQSEDVPAQRLAVDKASRSRLNGQRPCVVWFTGLSGAGKSTIANLVEKELHASGRHTYLLDGDNVRRGLSRDLGFSDRDRVENNRRIAEVARLMSDAGLIVLVAFISPFRAEREMARSLLPPGEYFEVHVDVPLAVAESRDPKGLYRRARRGELANFTGVDSRYELPVAPELHLRTDEISAEEAARRVVAMLAAAGRLAGS